VLTQAPAYSFELSLLWPHTRHLPSKVRTAIDALGQHMPPLLTLPCAASLGKEAGS
jgi:DNA-binding transcriptional LysR family regulator